MWRVTWYTLTPSGENVPWRASVGNETFARGEGTFDKEWGDGLIFKNFRDAVAFNATTTIRVPPQVRTVYFEIGSDDGSKLFVDGRLVIDNWGRHVYQRKQVSFPLDPGAHKLTLQYYDWDRNARLSFSVLLLDVLFWYD